MKKLILLILFSNLLLSNNNIFTQQEQQYLKKKKTIKMCVDPDWIPFEAIENGKHVGIIADIYQELQKKIDIPIELVVTKSWSDSLKAIQKRDCDILSAAVQTPEREQYLNFTKEYLTFPQVIVTREKTTFIEDFEDIITNKIGAKKGSAVIELVKAKYPGINIIEIKSIEDGLYKVSSGELYGFINTSATLSYALSKYGIVNLKLASKLGIDYNLKIGIRDDDEMLLNIMNKAIDQIDNKTIKKIKNRWLQLKVQNIIDYSKVYIILLVFGLILAIILYWNRKLKQEIKQRKKFETELQTQKEQLEIIQVELKKQTQKALLASKSKSEFLANMSHEIRTPMNAIIGFADLLSHLIKDPVQKDYLDSIQTGGRTLLTIINDILDLSKIEAGKFQIKKEAVNAKALFQEMETIFHLKINQKNLIFILDIDDKLPDSIIIDNVRVRQILINLIGNAIKFTDKGTITLEVRTTILDTKNSCDLKISIIDTGRGISKKFLKTIFGAFEQTNIADSRDIAGTGLGLAISAKLASLMGGKISVTSEVNVGSRFEVLLQDIEISNLEIEQEDDKTSIKRVRFEKVKILIVDDVVDNRKLIAGTLYDSNLEILEAQNGQEALDIIDDNDDIKLILMDLRMPIMDGYQATLKLKESEDTKDIPIIAFTASVMGKDLEKIEHYGFNGYLRKPIVYDDLILEFVKYLPHHISKIEDDKIDDILSNGNIKNITFVLEQLETNFRSELDKIKDKGDFTLIEEFVVKLKQFAQDNSIGVVEQYTNNLLLAIDSFDIEKVTQFINSYDTMCSKLKRYKDAK